MSNFLVGNTNYAPVWKDHGTGGGTSYTLDGSGTAVSTLVYVGGSIQEPGTDYTISGTAITMTTSVTSGIGVLTCQLYALGTVNVPADASVTTAKISDDQVTLAKMAGLARGTMIYGDASGDPAALAVGSADDVLTHDGTDIAWAAAGGGGWAWVSTQEASSSTLMEFTGFEAGYDYQVTWSDVDPSANHDYQFYFGTGATPTYQTSAYEYNCDAIQNSTQTGVTGAADTKFYMNPTGGGSSAGDRCTGIVTIINPARIGYTTCFWQYMCAVSSGGNQSGCGGGYRAVDEAVTAFKITPTAGNLTTGEFMLFRRANQ